MSYEKWLFLGSIAGLQCWLTICNVRFRVITSKTFTFLVGEKRTVMTVHSGMVSHHSPVLERLVDGGMAEAASGVATLEDVDIGTFASFSQWGYTGDYTPVNSEIPLDSSNIGEEPEPAQEVKVEALASDSDDDELQPVVAKPVSPEPAPSDPPPFSYFGGVSRSTKKGKFKKKLLMPVSPPW